MKNFRRFAFSALTVLAIGAPMSANRATAQSEQDTAAVETATDEQIPVQLYGQHINNNGGTAEVLYVLREREGRHGGIYTFYQNGELSRDRIKIEFHHDGRVEVHYYHADGDRHGEGHGSMTGTQVNWKIKSRNPGGSGYFRGYAAY